MNNIKVDISNVSPFLSNEKIDEFIDKAKAANEKLISRSGEGHESLGWLDLPEKYDRVEFTQIKETAGWIRQNCDAFVVVGIGGSYLGARSVIEALPSSGPEIFYAGNNLSGQYLINLLSKLENKSVCISVNSKSGTTTEPAVAFRFLRDFMERKYGQEEARKRIFITTDSDRGALLSMANEEKYRKFIFPSNIGGRYSVLSAAGLLPIAVAGINIDKLMTGASDEMKGNRDNTLVYAAHRNALYESGKKIEILASFEPSMQYFGEWWKQLFGESEGKDNRGIFPTTVNLTTDLHSMGQYIQQGERIIFETILGVTEPENSLLVPQSQNDLDQLNYLTGKPVDYINQKALEATAKAHTDGGVPNILINIPRIDESNIGKLIYFFERSCAISGYVLGINPFDQPGVEAYKKNMFRLLDKPDFRS